MKRIVIIIPYFGSFPNYFQLFLNSCACNPDIDWIIVTDNDGAYRYPSNVRVFRKSFDEVIERIKQCFDFDSYIGDVHKLCEYKPAYAYLFPELVDGYDFWGYGDVDLIYGDLRRVVTDDLLNNYSKIGNLGHLSLIRNDEKCNGLFMQECGGELPYRKAFSTKENYNFDEDFLDNMNINTIFRENDEYVYSLQKSIADIYVNSNRFRLAADHRVESLIEGFFLWEDGRLFRVIKRNNNILKKEYMYIHLQKRKMNVAVDEEMSTRRFKIIPNSFDDIEVDRVKTLDDFDRIRLFHPNNQYIRIRTKNLITKLKKRIGI